MFVVLIVAFAQDELPAPGWPFAPSLLLASVPNHADQLIVDGLFTCITNVNPLTRALLTQLLLRFVTRRTVSLQRLA